MIATKQILRYLKTTLDYGIKYEVNQKINLEGYVYSDLVGSSIDRKSTLGCYFSMRSSVISWFCKMESCIALSTAEAKDVSTCYLGGSMFLLKTLFDFLDLSCIFV